MKVKTLIKYYNPCFKDLNIVVFNEHYQELFQHIKDKYIDMPFDMPSDVANLYVDWFTTSDHGDIRELEIHTKDND